MFHSLLIFSTNSNTPLHRDLNPLVMFSPLLPVYPILDEQPSNITGIYIHRSRYPVQSVPSNRVRDAILYVLDRLYLHGWWTIALDRSIDQNLSWQSALRSRGKFFSREMMIFIPTKSRLPFASTGHIDFTSAPYRRRMLTFVR